MFFSSTMQIRSALWVSIVVSAGCDRAVMAPLPFAEDDQSAIVVSEDKSGVTAFAIARGQSQNVSLAVGATHVVLVYERTLVDLGIEPGAIEAAAPDAPSRALPGRPTQAARLIDAGPGPSWQQIDELPTSVLVFRLPDLGTSECFQVGCTSEHAIDLLDHRACVTPCPEPSALTHLEAVVPPQDPAPPSFAECGSDVWPYLCMERLRPLRLMCPQGEAQFQGSASCEPLGVCSTGPFPLDVPQDAIFVDADIAAEGIGTRDSPKKSLASTLANALAGTTVVARGSFHEVITVPANVNLIGACADTTRIIGTSSVVTIVGEMAGIDNFTIVADDGPALVVDGSVAPASLLARSIFVEAAERGITIKGAGASADFERLHVETTTTSALPAIRVENDASASFVDLIVNTRFRGLFIEEGGRVSVRRAVITIRGDGSVSATAIRAQSSHLDAADLDVSSTSHGLVLRAATASISDADFHDVVLSGVNAENTSLDFRRVVLDHIHTPFVVATSSLSLTDIAIRDAVQGLRGESVELELDRALFEISSQAISLQSSTATITNFMARGPAEEGAIADVLALFDSNVRLQRGSVENGRYNGVVSLNGRFEASDLRIANTAFTPELAAEPWALFLQGQSAVVMSRIACMDNARRAVAVGDTQGTIEDLRIDGFTHGDRAIGVRAVGVQLDFARFAIHGAIRGFSSLDSIITLDDLEAIGVPWVPENLTAAVDFSNGELSLHRARVHSFREVLAVQLADMNVVDFDVTESFLGVRASGDVVATIERSRWQVELGAEMSDEAELTLRDLELDTASSRGSASGVFDLLEKSRLVLDRFRISGDQGPAIQVQTEANVTLRDGLIEGHDVGLLFFDDRDLRGVIDRVDLTRNVRPIEHAK